MSIYSNYYVVKGLNNMKEDNKSEKSNHNLDVETRENKNSNSVEELPKHENAYPRFEYNNLTNILSSIINMQKKIAFNPDFINSIAKPLFDYSSPLMKAMQKIVEMQSNLINSIVNNVNISSFFKSLSKSIDDAMKNPHSFISWYNYYKKMSEYFWIYPYDMSPEQLHKVLENVSSEQEFDKYMSHYFSRKKVEELLSIIKKEIPKKHKRMINQIEKAYDMKLYSLCNNSLISIIDDLLSYYLGNKGCVPRSGIFEPIIEEMKEESEDVDDTVLITMMVNSYVNKLYDSINFNAIKINTHKKSRRGMSAHGKFTSNERSDFIMLINTIYHLLVVQEVLKKYKGRVFKSNKGFYIPKGKEYKKLKKNVDKDKKKESSIDSENDFTN